MKSLVNELKPKSKFYTYTQNNSGGTFIGPAHYVIVEAMSMDDAETIAEKNEIYFDGCDNGHDCSCCGDRWYRGADENKEPMIYGESLEDSSRSTLAEADKVKHVLVIYLDGTRKVYN